MSDEVSFTGETWEPREVCLTCRRPANVCYCAHVTRIPTRTKVVIFQHPRERDVPIGTARMASLCLENAELHVGVQWDGTKALREATSDPERPAMLLYPSEGARDVRRDPPEGPITLIVVDGTWWQARKLVRANPELAKLPRVAFSPDQGSEYRIRKEPKDEYVSTIEALFHTLSALEGDTARFEPLFRPFRAMVEAQLAYVASKKPGVRRHAPKPRKPRPLNIPHVLGERFDDLVAVVAEANAHPHRTNPRPEDELVQWVASRVSTGETFDVIARPRKVLAPWTAAHSMLGESRLQEGESLASLRAAWSSFSRPSDLFVAWGYYSPKLFGREVAPLSEMLDLREIARHHARGKVGTLEQFHAFLLGKEGASPSVARGRAGHRVALLSDVTKRFSDLVRSELTALQSAAIPRE